VAYAVLRDRARSEEVAQEAFLIAWQKMPALAEPPVLPGWLCGIARNLATNAARRRKESAMETEPAATTTPLDDVLGREADAIARGALARLSDADREVVVLYYRNDSTLDEVAAVIGVSPAAVRKRLERARTRLRDAVGVVEASLRRTRPGPAFTAGCVAALASGIVIRDASAATMTAKSTGTKLWIAGLAAGGIAVVGVGVHAASDRVASASESSSVTAGIARIDRATHDELRARIIELRTQRHDAMATAGRLPALELAPTYKVYDFSGDVLDGTEPPPPPVNAIAKLDKATLRRAVRLVEPMLFDCVKASPFRVDGTILTRFSIDSEPDVATIVTDVAVGGACADDPDLVECFSETLLSLELPRLAEAATVQLDYPFTVRRQDLSQ
jgi:RNA polymerase sigma factor (sigma-70 family)